MAKISDISICNQALGWLGQKSITSFADDSECAQLCDLNYPVLRDAVLESRTWTFALRTQMLESATSDEWNRGFLYPLDSDWLVVLRVYDEPPGWSPKDNRQMRWVREGNAIVAEKGQAYLWGVQRVLDTGRFTTLFAQALAARLAADLAITLTQNRQLQADMWSLYNDKLAEAAVRDGQQGRTERTTANTLVDARYR